MEHESFRATFLRWENLIFCIILIFLGNLDIRTERKACKSNCKHQTGV